MPVLNISRAENRIIEDQIFNLKEELLVIGTKVTSTYGNMPQFIKLVEEQTVIKRKVDGLVKYLKEVEK